jgi:hypothetical protein
MAREVGFEPTTHRLHLVLIFLLGVDYIITPLSGGEALPKTIKS